MELNEVIAVAESAEALQSDITFNEETVKAQKAKLREIIAETLPSMFTELGITDFNLQSGAHVGMKPIFAVSMPAPGTVAKAKPERKKELTARVRQCITWLNKHGGKSLVKNVITIEFQSGQEKIANSLFTELRKRKLKPSASKSVHAGTLKSHLRELWYKDTEIPEIFEPYMGQEAEIVMPKPSKKASGKAPKKSA